MKTAHCIESSRLEKGGGTEQAVRTLSDYFIRAGHQAEVLSCDGQAPVKAIICERFLRLLLHGRTIFTVSEDLHQTTISHCRADPSNVRCVGSPVKAMNGYSEKAL